MASIALWGRDIAMAEDWGMVPAMTGHQPDLLAWLWSQNNEHRLPVQRLIYLLLLRTTEDFRSGMVLSQLLLTGLVAALAVAAARLRGGGARWCDLLFPLALLHLGHWENMVWGWQLQFVWSIVLSGALLALIVAEPRPLDRRRGLLATVMLLLLAISGANGIIMALSLTPWLAANGLARLRGHGGEADRRLGLALLVGAFLCLGAIGAYFVGYQRPSWVPPPPDLRQFFRASALYFAYALGPSARWLWHPAFAVAGSFMASGGLLALRALLRGSREERLRALGLSLYLCGCFALGMAIAWGRGALPSWIVDRYALLSAPALIAAAFAWQLYSRPRLGRALVGLLALLFLMILPFNIVAGLKWRDWYVSGMQEVEADIAKGLPPETLARRHTAFLSWGPEHLASAIEMLREAHIGPFAERPRAP